jgi:RNA-directed DNA polymerase
MIADKIASELGLTPDYILRVARSASFRYKTYDIPKKRDPKLKRTINHPARELKLLQRWIVKSVVSRLPIHRCATAYKKGSSVLKNARRHRRTKYLLKIDFHDFFPSLTGRDVISLLRRNASALRELVSGTTDFDLIRRLVCKNDRLTIGAPSSPSLSNAIMFTLDTAIFERCRKQGVTYTRYADDLYFSTNKQETLSPLLAEIRKMLSREKHPSLTVNEQKTAFSSRKRRKVVTGLVLTPEGAVSVGRDKIRHVRSLVFQGMQGKLSPEEMASLRGMLSYIQSVDSDVVERMRAKFTKKFSGHLVTSILPADKSDISSEGPSSP